MSARTCGFDSRSRHQSPGIIAAAAALSVNGCEPVKGLGPGSIDRRGRGVNGVEFAPAAGYGRRCVKPMQAVYYRAPDGTQPVRDFVARLRPVAARVVIENQIDRLNLCSEAGPPLPFPHSSQVDGELRELRCHYGRYHFRVLYRRSRNLFVLLHVVPKTTAKLPPEAIEIANERWKNFASRMAANPRVPPRPAGHDAPRRRDNRA
jgi:phage-related protein